MEQQSVNQRLNLVVDTFEKGKKAAFARKTGISPQGAQELLAGRKGDPSFKVLIKILEAYPQISTDWLLFGKGDMLRSEEGADDIDETEKENTIKSLFPPGEKSFFPEGYLEGLEKRRQEDDMRRQEEWTHYHALIKQHENDRLVLWKMVEHMAKNDPTGEVAEIRALLPSALMQVVDPDTRDREMEARHQEELDKFHADEQAKLERQSKGAENSQKQTGQQ